MPAAGLRLGRNCLGSSVSIGELMGFAENRDAICVFACQS